jgi:flagellar hook-length control protein FliK
MQAVSISNVSPVKTPDSGDVSLLSPGPQQSSPFAALFQAKLKVANDATKLPAQGKAKDSARAKDSPGIGLNSLAIAAPSVPQPPISASRTTADGAPNQNLVAATNVMQLPAFAIPSVNAAQHDDNSANLQTIATIQQTDTNVTTTNSKPVSQIADATSSPLLAFSLAASNAARVEGIAKVAEAVGSLPVHHAVGNNAAFNARRPVQMMDAAPNMPVSSTNASQEEGSGEATDAMAAASNSQNPSLRTSAPPLGTAPQPDANMAAFESKLGVQIANTAPNPSVASNLAPTRTPAGKDASKSADKFVAPLNRQNLSALPSPEMKVSLAGAPQQTLPPRVISDLNSDAKITISAPRNEALHNLSSGGSPEPQGSASPRGADGAPADMQNQISSLRDTANLPLSQMPAAEAPQAISPVASSQTEHKPASPNSSGGANFQVMQAVNAEIEMLNLPIREAAPAQANPVQQIPQSAITGNNSPLPESLQTAMTPIISATPAAPAAKTTVAGLPAINSRDAMHPQAANILPPVQSGVAPAKQSKDASNGSQGNDSNTKRDHAANSGAGHTDAKGSVQSLETPGANSGSMHAAFTDSTIVAAAMRAPAEPHAANADTKPGSSNLSTSAQGQALPSPAAAEQNVVNAAHLLDHAGQTEIRIEMQGGSLGGVELRAHMSGNDIGASIAVEHHDVQDMLANDLPALHNALIEKNLRVDYLSVSQGMPGSMNGGAGSDAGHRSFYQPHPKASYAAQDERPIAVVNDAAEYSGMTNRTLGLSVLA